VVVCVSRTDSFKSRQLLRQQKLVFFIQNRSKAREGFWDKAASPHETEFTGEMFGGAPLWIQSHAGKGTRDGRRHAQLSRPFGTLHFRNRFPALKRRAILAKSLRDSLYRSKT